MRGEARQHGPDPLPHQHRAPRRPHLRQLLVQGRRPVVHHQGVYDNFMDPHPSSTRSRTPSRRSRPTTPTARRSSPTARPTTRTRTRAHRVHRRPDAPGRRPDVPPAPHAGPHAGPARRVRPRGARRLHRRHDLLRVPDLADDLERRPVARGARADPPLDVDHVVPGHGPVQPTSYLARQQAFLLEWSGGRDAVAKGWSREETIARVASRQVRSRSTSARAT